jgi:hypothetical protein
MEIVLIEAGQSIEDPKGPNHGKFCVGRFDAADWAVRSIFDKNASLIRLCGWPPNFVWVFDLQTGEAAYVRPGGYARADLQKHRVWVCPMFEPFLEWLYKQDLTDLSKLPSAVALPDAPFSFRGTRRLGTVEVNLEALIYVMAHVNDEVSGHPKPEHWHLPILTEAIEMVNQDLQGELEKRSHDHD